MLRASKDRLIHVAVAQMIDHRQDGDLLSDALAHDGSIEKLIELAEDRDEWRKRVHKLAPKKKVNKRAASTEEEEYKNHKQDMPWADSQKSQKQMRERSEAERQIAALPVGSIIAYTDGGERPARPSRPRRWRRFRRAATKRLCSAALACSR